jgi:NADH-quinone oxidoreductase subunit G
MTVMTGHVYRKSRFRKRTHRNQYLGPFVNHEMNRCIQCYRCVRFYRDYAGGRDLEVFGSHDHVYFGRQKEGVLENDFSGNLVEVCPTGVFTDKTFKRHYTRKWDLQSAPSLCVHCGVGCNTIAGERYGELRRILSRYHEEVNGYFLCDRGRFGYEFVNSGKRIRQAMILNKDRGVREPASTGGVLEHLSRVLHFGAKVIGIGSPRASLEANFALRELVGPEHFFSGLSKRDHLLVSAIIGIQGKGPARSPSLRDVTSSDAVLILGEDVANTAPMLSLSLRQSVRQRPLEILKKLNIPLWHEAAVRNAVQEQRGPLFIAAPDIAQLDGIATETYQGAPPDIARLGFAVAHELDPRIPEIPGMSAEKISLAQRMARSLMDAKRPLIVSGMGSGTEEIIHAAANVAWALCRNGHPAQLCFAVPECNTLGSGLMGGGHLSEAFRLAEEGRADTVIILENDLYQREDAARVEAFLNSCAHVIVIDHLSTRTTSSAEVVIPCGTFAESDGTLINNEGRAQRFFRVFAADENIQESWRWMRDLMVSSRRPVKWKSLDELILSMAEALPVFAPVKEISPVSGFRIAGQKIPRQPHRYSGRTAMHADISVHESRPPDDPDSPLSFSMEGYQGVPPSSLIQRFWYPAWNSVQALNKFQKEVGGALRGGDPGKRLIEPAGEGEPLYFDKIPGAFEPRENEVFVVPLYHIFGSEELSILSPGIAERAPVPYVAMNPEDAERLLVEDGRIVEVTIARVVCVLPVVKKVSLPRGIAGIPAGLPGLEGVTLPEWGRIRGKRDE